jgi:hypothetical protein
MAYPDYFAVMASSLYDGHPVKKAILSRIAYLVRDKKEPIGWCTAGQQYLADQTGSALITVAKAVAQFVEDGVIDVQKIRKHSRTYNRYRLNRGKIDAALRPKRVYTEVKLEARESFEEDEPEEDEPEEDVWE